jgi:hypothetical protein
MCLSKEFVYDFRTNRQSVELSLEDAMSVLAKTSMKPMTDSTYMRICQLQEIIAGLERQIAFYARDKHKREEIDVPQDDIDSLNESLKLAQLELEAKLSLEPSNSIVPVYVHSFENLKRSMVYNGPIVIELPVYDKNSPNGQFFIPPESSSSFWKTVSSHKIWPKQCVVIVAYSDTSQNFLIRNSWGSQWNGNGHAWISYDYLRKNKVKAMTFVQKDLLSTFQKRQVESSSGEIKVMSTNSVGTSSLLIDPSNISGGVTTRPSKTLMSNVKPAPKQSSMSNTMSFLGLVATILNKSKSLCF